MTVKSYPWLMKHSCILPRRVLNLSRSFDGQLSSHGREESLLHSSNGLTRRPTTLLFTGLPRSTNLHKLIHRLLIFKLITIKLKKNKTQRRWTPVSHIKVVAWLRTDSDTWQVLIKYGPLVPEGGRRDHRWTTLANWSLIVNPVGIVDHRPFLVNKTPPYHFSDGQKIYRSTQTNHSSP